MTLSLIGKEFELKQERGWRTYGWYSCGCGEMVMYEKARVDSGELKLCESCKRKERKAKKANANIPPVS